MTCEICGTIERYGKRVKTGKKMCIDCWKLKETKENEKDSSSGSTEE